MSTCQRLDRPLVKGDVTNDYLIRRQTVSFGISLVTNIQLAQRFVEVLSRNQLDDLTIRSWNEYNREESSLQAKELR